MVKILAAGGEWVHGVAEGGVGKGFSGGAVVKQAKSK